MKLIDSPPMAAPVSATPEEPVRRAPGVLQVPALDDGSAAASASLGQVASYVGMLHTALGEDPAFYAGLVKRGFLESAIQYARYSLEVIDVDRHTDNDGFIGMVEGAVLEALLAARNMGTPSVADPALSNELAMAKAAASNAADALIALATRPPRA